MRITPWTWLFSTSTDPILALLPIPVATLAEFCTFDWLTTTLAEQRNQIAWFADPALMDWLCGARLDLMRHMYAPLIGQPEKVRNKVFGLITNGLHSANQKLEKLLSEHLSASADVRV